MARRARGTGGAGKWIAVVVVLLVLGGGGAGAGWYFFLRSTPEKTMEQYVAATMAGDEAGAKACLSSESQREAGPVAGGMGAFLRGLAGRGAGGEEEKTQAEYEIGKAKIEGKRATVPLTVPVPERVSQATGTTEFTINCVLLKEDGRWKIDLRETGEEMMRGWGGSRFPRRER
jgi:hypothetical protein